ncbi:MAG: ABC transporter ATP-binding protein, partial [Bacteroidetes bacterium]|nr:ABC transporter ATP-binding protein [Bacteroidota bacterium]
MSNDQSYNQSDWVVFKRLMSQAIPYSRILLGALFVGIMIAILGPLRPWIIQDIIDKYILEYDHAGLRRMSLILFGVLFLETFCRYLFSYSTSYLGQSVIKDIRLKVFRHIQQFKLQYFDKTPIGNAVTRTINDVEAINNTFSQGILSIVSDILLLVAVIVAMLLRNWRLALVCLATFPLLLIATYIFKEKIKSSFQTVREKVSQMNSFLQEHITGMRIIQIFNAEKREMGKFDSINQEHRNANLRSVFYYSTFFPVVEIILALALALMLWYGSNQVMLNKESIGVFTAFLLYLNMAFRPLRMLADKFNTLQMGIVASRRVFQVLDKEQVIVDAGKFSPDSMEGSLKFDSVWFAYNDDDYVLKDLSFEVGRGKTVALVGATGSGKTSTINILSRFYEINRGNILIDDVDLREYQLNKLRSSIAVVLQDVFLFSGSVLDNITMNNHNISLDTVIEASKLVGAHEFISSLPEGYHYKVMERGATLSVGQ